MALPRFRLLKRITTHFSPSLPSLSFRKQAKHTRYAIEFNPIVKHTLGLSNQLNPVVKHTLGLSNQLNAIAGSGAPLQELTSLSGYFEALRSKKECYEANVIRRDAQFFASIFRLHFGREIQINDVLPQVLPFPVKRCSLYDLILLNSLQESYAIQNVDLMGLGVNGDLIIDMMRNLVHKIRGFHASGDVMLKLNPQDIAVSEEDCILFPSIDLEDHDSLGWKAPEHLLYHKQTEASNMFSFGCILYFCISGGFHPFGDTLDCRINNIKANKMDISRATNDDAYNLISRLLSPEPEMRPNAKEVLRHPFFWVLLGKVKFLIHILKYMEDYEILGKDLESKCKVLTNSDWRKKCYDCFNAMLDMEKPTAKHIPDVFGPPGSPTFLPKLLMESYESAIKHVKFEDDELLQEYDFYSIGYRLF